MSLPNGGDAEKGFYDRISRDLDMTQLLGEKPNGRANAHWGFPGLPLTEAECPRLTYFPPLEATVRPGLIRIRLQTDLWAWPSGDHGGPERLRALDVRLMELLDERMWTFRGVRLYAIALAGRTVPSSPDRPLRRTRDYQITASPGTPEL